MKRVILATLGVAAVCLWTATQALAGPVNVRPVAVNVGAEQSLQSIFAGIGSSIDVNTDQEVYAYFSPQASGGAIAQMIVEIAGNAGLNEYGLYKLGDPTQKVPVFVGSDSSGSRKTINWNLAGDVWVDDTTGFPTVPGAVLYTGFGSVFGFYLAAGQTVLYSEDALNPGGAAQALVFAGKGDNVNVPNAPTGLSDANYFYIAWEDVLGGDYDFNDGVFVVESITGVPEPGLLGLLGMGFLAAATSFRRRLRA